MSFEVGQRVVCTFLPPAFEDDLREVIGMTGTVVNPRASVWVEVKMDEDISHIDHLAPDNMLLFNPDEIEVVENADA